jgi:murein DD-endopeptidase MepM/ murein hydrolase activator NlpD
MNKKRYTYDSVTDTFTEYKVNPKKRILKATAYLTSIVVTAFVFYFVFSIYLPSPNEMSLMKRLDELKAEYAQLNMEVNDMTAVLDNIRDRDAEVYQLLLGSQPVDDHIWNGGIGGHDIDGEKITSEISLTALNNSIEEMERKLVLQSKYLEDVEKSALEKDLRLTNIPSIRPIQMSTSDYYLRMLSGYGMRKHPVHKVNKMHTGLDFPAPKGTPVVATGNGKVVRIRKERSGYGRSIIIDHGFGYQSLYAHMDKIDVKEGQEINRGQQIGTVGRTGTATAPHVHYEVRQNDKPINPIHYCMDGLTPEEYHDLLEAASVHNHSFD